MLGAGRRHVNDPPVVHLQLVVALGHGQEFLGGQHDVRQERGDGGDKTRAHGAGSSYLGYPPAGLDLLLTLAVLLLLAGDRRRVRLGFSPHRGRWPGVTDRLDEGAAGFFAGGQ